MSGSRADYFENGIFWDLYLDLERQFLHFLDYVPYLNSNEEVTSFRLLNLILSIGGYVDSSFKEMARYSGFAENQGCKDILDILEKSEKRLSEGRPPIPVSFTSALKTFEEIYSLSARVVIFKRSPNFERLVPFMPYNPVTLTPKWWDVYNGLKHDVGVNMKDANLKNARDSIACAFLVNAVHMPSYLRFYETQMLKLHKAGYYTVSDEEEKRASARDTLTTWWLSEEKGYGYIETNLFIFDYEKSKIVIQ